jgi:hypothetical protein
MSTGGRPFQSVKKKPDVSAVACTIHLTFSFFRNPWYYSGRKFRVEKNWMFAHDMFHPVVICILIYRTGWSCSKAVYKPVWHSPLLSVQWINSLWWTEELSETCRVSCRNEFVKSVHLVGFIIKKFVTMHGHMNVKFSWQYQDRIPGFTITFSAKSLHYGTRQLAAVIMLVVCIRKIHVSNFSMYPNNLTVVNRSLRANSREIHPMKSWPPPFASFSVYWLQLPCNSTLTWDVETCFEFL